MALLGFEPGTVTFSTIMILCRKDPSKSKCVLAQMAISHVALCRKQEKRIKNKMALWGFEPGTVTFSTIMILCRKDLSKSKCVLAQMAISHVALCAENKRRE